MTRKTRPRQLRIHTAFQSGFCAVCHLPYNSLDDHIQSKKHQKLIGDDVGFISLKAFDDDTSLTSFLALDDIDAIAINTRPYDCSPPHPQPKRRRMPRTARTAPLSVTTTCDRHARAKESSPLSPVDSDSGGGHHRLRSRKNINYMTPPLEEDSLTEKPDDDDEEGGEGVKEFRELRSSTRLMAKLTTQIPENDEVWNSGRPKRRCNRQRISADERLVVDNKSYYKVEVLPTKLRSGVAPFNMDFVGRHRSPDSNNHPLSSDQRKNDQGLIVKFKKMRNSELVQLNNEAENFLFPKKDDSSDDEDSDGDEEENGGEGTTTEDDAPSADSNYVMKTDTSSISLDPTVTMTTTDENTCSSHQTTSRKSLKSAEDDESQHSTCSESKSGGGGGGGGFGGRKRKRRTHAEAFIMDNQKYYKFETPGSRLRYHGSYLSPLNWKTKNNGDCCGGRTPKEDHHDPDTEIDPNFKLNLNDYNFSFEKVPKEEGWFQTFQRRDRGEEKYAFLGDDNYWDPLILPYQLKSVPPLDPKSCISQYTHIKKCLDTAATSETNIEPTASASTSISCNTSDLNPSNNSSQPGNNENTQHQSQPEDEDSKISAATSTVTDEDSSCCSSSQTQVPHGPANGGDDVVKSPPPAAVSPTRRKAGRPPKLKKRTDIVQQTVANVSPTGGGGADNKGRNPRKSPRQHASTLAILSSLIHQRKRKARRAEMNNRSHLPTIMEEPRSGTSPIKANNRSRHLNQNQQRRENILKTQEYLSIAKKFEEELTQMGCGDVANLLSNDEVEDTRGEQLELLATTSAGTTTATTVETPGGSAFNDSSPIYFRTSINIIDVLHSYDSTREKDTKASQKRFLQGNKHEARKPGRKKKKNMTGWPNRCRRVRRDRGDNVKEEDDNSTVDSGSINADSADENDDILGDHVTDSIIKGNSRKKDASKLLNGESNNKKTENSSSVANLNTSTISSSSSKVTENNSSIIDSIKCDSKVNSESVKNNSSNSAKVNLNLQPYVRVQKLDKSRLGGRGGGLEQHPTTSGAQHQQSRRGGGSGNGNSNDTSPRRAIRGQRRRRMPASPKSPRMLRRPRGRWYRER